MEHVYIGERVYDLYGMGCYAEGNLWYAYYIDDHLHMLISGPYSQNGVIVALAFMLYIPDELMEHTFTEEEENTYLKGYRPADGI